MPSQWKILAICGVCIMFGVWGLVEVLGTKPEIIQESEVTPVGVFYNKALKLPAHGEFSKKMSWYDEVVSVSIVANNLSSSLFAYVKSTDGETIWSSQFVGEIKDSFIVVPGKSYVTAISNGSEESIIVDYGLENTYFEDREGNFAITQHGKYILVLIGVGIGVTLIIVGGIKMN